MCDLLTVIMPVYNSLRYLDESVGSLIAQDYPALEIVLVDDGSTDGSGGKIDELAKTDGRIKVLHKENGGPLSAKLAGVKAAGGEYITFCDSDDFMREGGYTKMMAAFADSGADMLITGYYEVHSDGKSEYFPPRLPAGNYLGAEFDEKIRPKILDRRRLSSVSNLGFYMVNRIYRKEIVLRNLEFMDEGVCMWDDQIFNAPIFLDMDGVRILDEGYYEYRIRDVSLSHGFNGRLFSDADRHSAALDGLLEKRKLGSRVETQFARMKAAVLNTLLWRIVAGVENEKQARALIKQALSRPWAKTALKKARGYELPNNRINLFFMRHGMVRVSYATRKRLLKKGRTV